MQDALYNPTGACMFLLDVGGPALFISSDMINDLVHPDGPVGGRRRPESKQSRETSSSPLRWRSNASELRICPVGFVRHWLRGRLSRAPVELAPPKRGVRSRSVQAGQLGTAVHADISRRPRDLDNVKHRVSPFYSTTLDATLRANLVRRIYCWRVNKRGSARNLARSTRSRLPNDFHRGLLQRAFIRKPIWLFKQWCASSAFLS